MDLTDKQEQFCLEYIIDLNATQAAIRAGYSVNTAKEIGSQNLSKVNLQERIQQLMHERREAVKVDAEYVLRRLVDIDAMDVLDILTESGDMKPVSEWPKVWRTTLSGLDISVMMGEGDNAAMMKKIKWPDKVRNLELLGKHINVQAFKEQAAHEHTGKDGGPVQVVSMNPEDIKRVIENDDC